MREGGGKLLLEAMATKYYHNSHDIVMLTGYGGIYIPEETLSEEGY
jgi:hypothetical protein